MAPKDKIRSRIYRIDRETNKLLGSKIFSYKQVMRVLFCNMRYIILSFLESACLANSDTIVFKLKARIPYKET